MLHPHKDRGEALRAWRASWRLSWEQLQPRLDRAATLDFRRDLFFRQALQKARHVLEARQDLCLHPLIRAAVGEGCSGPLLATLDKGECAGCYSKEQDYVVCPACPLCHQLKGLKTRGPCNSKIEETLEFVF